MARASWKYHFYKKNEITAYVNYLLDVPQSEILSKRKTTITKLNCFNYAEVYTGKYTLEKRFSKYHIGLKLGAFTKNRKPFYFRSKKKKMLQKNTNYTIQLSTIPNNFKSKVENINSINNEHKVAHLVFLDMLELLKMWRHVKGYPANGQTTYTNANTSKKNKTLLNFRLEQFYKMFGKKKRNIFPTLIQAEYNNRLWHNLWYLEWAQGTQFVFSLVNPNKQTIAFDPVSLAKGQTNGYVRVGNASKIGKAKKITKQCTVGVPMFFTRYIYAELLPAIFPYRLLIADDLRKKMGKKKRKCHKKSIT